LRVPLSTSRKASRQKVETETLRPFAKKKTPVGSGRFR
jgi:hypothetical protein